MRAPPAGRAAVPKPVKRGRRFAMYDQVLVSVFLGAACLVVYLEFLRETAVHEKPATRHD
jgi:hypothetical protein